MYQVQALPPLTTLPRRRESLHKSLGLPLIRSAEIIHEPVSDACCLRPGLLAAHPWNHCDKGLGLSWLGPSGPTLRPGFYSHSDSMVPAQWVAGMGRNVYWGGNQQHLLHLGCCSPVKIPRPPPGYPRNKELEEKQLSKEDGGEKDPSQTYDLLQIPVNWFVNTWVQAFSESLILDPLVGTLLTLPSSFLELLVRRQDGYHPFTLSTLLVCDASFPHTCPVSSGYSLFTPQGSPASQTPPDRPS